MSGGPDEYPDITNKEPRVKEIRTEPPEEEKEQKGGGKISNVRWVAMPVLNGDGLMVLDTVAIQKCEF